MRGLQSYVHNVESLSIYGSHLKFVVAGKVVCQV